MYNCINDGRKTQIPDIKATHSFGKKRFVFGIILELIIPIYSQPVSIETWEVVNKAQVFFNHRVGFWAMAKWDFLLCLAVEE